VDILFKSERFARECNAIRLLMNRHGESRAKLIRRRLDALRSAWVLEDLRNAPGRLHELKGDLKWALSLDLDGPYRLLFEPAAEPVPLKPDGGLDWTKVTAVRILGIEDTHE